MCCNMSSEWIYNRIQLRTQQFTVYYNNTLQTCSTITITARLGYLKHSVTVIQCQRRSRCHANLHIPAYSMCSHNENICHTQENDSNVTLVCRVHLCSENCSWKVIKHEWEQQHRSHMPTFLSAGCLLVPYFILHLICVYDCRRGKQEIAFRRAKVQRHWIGTNVFILIRWKEFYGFLILFHIQSTPVAAAVRLLGKLHFL